MFRKDDITGSNPLSGSTPSNNLQDSARNCTPARIRFAANSANLIPRFPTPRQQPLKTAPQSPPTPRRPPSPPRPSSGQPLPRCHWPEPRRSSRHPRASTRGSPLKRGHTAPSSSLYMLYEYIKPSIRLHMRIHLDANMSFHKTTWQSRPIIAATGVGSVSLPGQPPSVFAICPYRHAQWARCAQPAGQFRPRVRPRAARTRAARPTPPCPRAPHAARCDRPTFPAPLQARSPGTQNRWPVTTTSTLSCPR